MVISFHYEHSLPRPRDINLKMKLGCCPHLLALIIQETQFNKESLSREIISNYMNTCTLPKSVKSDYRSHSAWKYRLTKGLGGIFCPSPCPLMPTTTISSGGHSVRHPGELVNLPSNTWKHCHIQRYQRSDDTEGCYIANSQCRAINHSLRYKPYLAL